jgi:hypothetical protein
MFSQIPFPIVCVGVFAMKYNFIQKDFILLDSENFPKANDIKK